MIVWDIDWRSPYEAFAPLAGEPHAHLLHGGDQSDAAEWSIIAAFPDSLVGVVDGFDRSDPFQQLQECISERSISMARRSKDLPFISGLVGFMGYEAARHTEAALDLPLSPFALPDMAFGAYDAAALFSRRTKCAFIAGRNENACRRLRDALGKCLPTPEASAVFRALTSNFTPLRYEAGVRSVLEDILNGNYYQANIAHQISAFADREIDAFGLFRRLAGASDAFFGALLQLPEGAILSNSPERFFSVSSSATCERRIVAEPVKGTRPRGATPALDQALAKELQSDRKDRAENIMIADLMRNDLSRICNGGSIHEEDICALLSLANVHHLVSRISGELRPSVSIAEVFEALFPCGSVTGAPKIEAMNAIAKIEEIGRGPYCGAIGYVDDRGGAEFSVAIRTMIVAQDKRSLTIPVGGGITLRSDPQKEYQETITKASAALEAIGKSPQELL